MKRILIVKITSMGDLIQLLPALTDAANAIPGIRFDWLIDESFQDIAQLHPSIDNIIAIPYRRWKNSLPQGIKFSEVRQFLRHVRSLRYDMVIDAQSNLKSAFITLLTKGKKYGLDGKSVREYGAQFAYSKKIKVSRQQNHAARMRELMATFLAYELPKSPADYGIQHEKLPVTDIQLPEKFVFMTPISSRAERLWPEPFWQEVINDVVQNYEIVLPWWSQQEKERVTRLKNNNQKIHLLPPLSLTEKAGVLSKAVAAISVDTGLAHMAAALNIPNVTVYGSTDAKLTGAYGKDQVHLSASGPSCSPCLRTKCSYQGSSQYKPACLETIPPKQVLHAFYELLEHTGR